MSSILYNLLCVGSKGQSSHFWVVFVALVDFLALFVRSFLSLEMFCLLQFFHPHLLENDCCTQDLRRLASRSSPGAICDVF